MKRKVVFFVVTQLVLVGVLYVTLNSDLNFALIDPFAKDKTIEIISSNRDSGKLELLPPDTEHVYAGKKVIWKIGKTATDVESFYIAPKGDQPIVFTHEPPGGNRQRAATGYLKKQDADIDYVYKIRWRDADNNPHWHDPKIAIRPGSNLTIYILYALLVALMSFIAYRR